MLLKVEKGRVTWFIVYTITMSQFKIYVNIAVFGKLYDQTEISVILLPVCVKKPQTLQI